MHGFPKGRGYFLDAICAMAFEGVFSRAERRTSMLPRCVFAVVLCGPGVCLARPASVPYLLLRMLAGRRDKNAKSSVLI